MNALGKQVAVITGGASGLGAALGGLFGREEMAVVVIDIDGPKAEAAASTLPAIAGGLAKGGLRPSHWAA